MFDLVGKRYLFLIISLLVIIPGAISLLIFHLNVGIDFAGGTNIEFRPDKEISIPAMMNVLKPLKYSGLQVVTGSDNSIPGNRTVWVRLNTQVDSNVENTIIKNLRDAYGAQLAVDFTPLPFNGKTVTVVTITKFNQTPDVTGIQKALAKLPDTSDPTKGAPTLPVTPTPTASATGTPVVTGTGTPSATGTPKVTAAGTPAATATPHATATPKVTGTATPVASPTAATGPLAPVASPTGTPVTTPSNPANIPVNVVDVRQGSTTETITLLTLSVVSPMDLLQLESTILKGANSYIQVLDNASVTGSVAGQTVVNAFLAVVAASVLILLYIWFAFRKVAKSWRYGTCAIIALLHDVLVVLGVFSILGWTLHIQIDALFITALLTVVGFSVHDTIVVFDRIRENMLHRTSETFEQVVNASLVQTMARSLNTSLTVLITLTALTVFGGVTIREFTLTLLVGIFSGTYSSIFNASMLLVIWEKGELGLDRLDRDHERVTHKREARELARTRG